MSGSGTPPATPGSPNCRSAVSSVACRPADSDSCGSEATASPRGTAFSPRRSAAIASCGMPQPSPPQQRVDTPVDVRRQVVLEHTAQLAEQPHDDVRLPLLLDAARDGREHPHALGVAGVLAAHELPDDRRDGERAVCLHHPLDDA